LTAQTVESELEPVGTLLKQCSCTQTVLVFCSVRPREVWLLVRPQHGVRFPEQAVQRTGGPASQLALKQAQRRP